MAESGKITEDTIDVLKQLEVKQKDWILWPNFKQVSPNILISSTK